MYKYAGIIVNNESIQLDKIFTYKIPEKLINSIDLGFRVKVPFGKGNKKIDGFIIELYEEIEDKENINKLKEIISVSDNFQALSYKDLKLIKYMKPKYLCTYLECIKSIIPSGILKGVKNKVNYVIYAGEELTGKFLKEPYLTIYKTIKENDGIYNKNQLNKEFGFSISSINTLIKHKFLMQHEKIINRYNAKEYKVYPAKKLNIEQQNAVDTILNSSKNMFLIHGVTGSGKTEIYMNLVSEMLKRNKESIILVPEIALTPQMVERFKGRFGKDVTVFHSKLSDGERYDEWLRVKSGKVKLAIGARSAIFLPFNNLGLIVIDEEHEGSYKSDSNPKYSAREIAEMKCNLYDCKLILGSATPSIETYYNCTVGKLELITIENRADGALMPNVEVSDMREELANNNRSIFSKTLYNGIKSSLEKKEQVILFLNRRGFSTFVSCRKCGYVFKCENCDIALTYHSHSNNLTCHYCGSRKILTRVCPECGSKYVKYFGVGTEKVEQEVKKCFPNARTVRMDFDTTRKKDSYEKIYNYFKEGKADVLIGTQMVAKGLDFKNVTLVGVIAADLSLNFPDFHASERTFQLITQVSGRAGRGQKRGNVIVQTYNPDNFSIKYAVKNDYKNFFKEEIMIRDVMGYPPFSKILLINMSSKNEDILIKNIQNVGIYLKNIIDKYDKINMLGPCPCGISKIKNNYRWQIILKGNINEDFSNNIKNTIYKLIKNVYNDIRVSIDPNPNSLI